MEDNEDQAPDDNRPAEGLGQEDIDSKPSEIGEPSQAYKEPLEQPEPPNPTADVDAAQEALEQAGKAAEPEKYTEPDDSAPEETGEPSIADEGISPPGVRHHDDSTGDVPSGYEPPSEETHHSVDAPSHAEVEDRQNSMEEFGNAVSAYNEGGADFDGGGGQENYTGDIDSGDDSEGQRNGMEQLQESDFANRSQMKDMLIEYARRLDEMTRFLEMERL